MSFHVTRDAMKKKKQRKMFSFSNIFGNILNFKLLLKGKALKSLFKRKKKLRYLLKLYYKYNVSAR